MSISIKGYFCRTNIYKNYTMKRQILAFAAIASLFFACKGGGGGDKYTGQWIGTCMGSADTFSIVMKGADYKIVHRTDSMALAVNGDSLIINQGGMKVAFKYAADGSLSTTLGTNTCSYTKKK